MARVTTEDCIDKIPNRFELVMLAAFRARELSEGVPTTIDPENDKNPVIALREIAEEVQSAANLQERAISSNQKENEVDEPEEIRMTLPSQGAMYSLRVEDDKPDEMMSEEAMLKRLREEG